MYVSNIHSAEIVAYGLLENDYINYFNDIDKERLSVFEIEYNKEWLEKEYIPKINYLSECLKKQIFPDVEEFRKRCNYE